MITTEQLITAVRQIADSRPTYRTGGTGADGTCDCIGLIMGAMYAAGRPKYDMHSSNYFARFQTQNLTRLTSAEQLKPGMIVYKATADTDGLNARYLSGGRYDTGDRLDYYHAGAVESCSPLCIVHCTSTGGANGIVRDDEADGWTHCGTVCGVDDDPTQTAGEAIVTASSGSTVNLRARPDRQSAVLARVPLGTAVAVHERADGWARVTAGGRSGYMMEDFLLEQAQTTQVCLPEDAVLDIIQTLNAAVSTARQEENT